MKRFLKLFASLLSIHLLALLLSSLFRVAFWCGLSGQLPAEAQGRLALALPAFVRGLWFDNVMVSYISILPLLVGGLFCVAGRLPKWFIRVLAGWYSVLYLLLFVCLSANIPFYGQFGKVLNVVVWNWMADVATTAGLIFTEASFWGYIALFAVVCAFFVFCVLKCCARLCRVVRGLPSALSGGERVRVLLCVLVAVFACFTGIRGGLGRYPIRVSDAYYCTYPLLNAMGVNPAFNLLKTTTDELKNKDKKLNLMPVGEALAASRSYLGRTGIEGVSPIANRVVRQGKPTRQNVVLVLMESLSAKYMARFGGVAGLTPCLDSLFQNSIAFTNFYSSGTHTHQAVYTAATSFPSVLGRNLMKNGVLSRYNGLASVLKGKGYSTSFFINGKSEYDNMNAFMRTNDYDQIVEESDYPASKVMNSFGVADETLFQYTIAELNKKAASGRPFLATVLTVSNHQPIVLPASFKGHAAKLEDRAVEYADHCVGRFLASALRQEWSRNTIFVFMGDHGHLLGPSECEIPEAYHHIPLIIYTPGITPREVPAYGIQADVAPTVLGLLNEAYTQTDMGIDLFRQQRPAVITSADDAIAARDSSHIFVYNPSLKKESCYQVSGGVTRPCALTPRHQQLRHYCFSLYQTAEHLVAADKVFIPAEWVPEK